MLIEGRGWGGKRGAPGWGSGSLLSISVTLGSHFNSPVAVSSELVGFGNLTSNAIRGLEKKVEDKR